MPQKFPLEWPVGYPRNSYGKRSRFKNITLYRCVQTILEEINRLNGFRPGYEDKNVFISSNIPLKNDGFPRSDYASSKISDKGVAVYFKYGKKDMVLCCDEWNTIEDNMKAIFTTISAIRGIERWGVSDFIERSFQGFTALPESPKKEPWYSILGFNGIPSDFKHIISHYRQFSKERHPDMPGGSHEKFTALNNAYEEAKVYFGEK